MTTPRDADLRRIESEVLVLLRRIKRVLVERAHAIHADLGPTSYLLLSRIIAAGELRGSDLAGSFGVDKGGVSRGVQHLVDLGLVERSPDPEDRRASLLRATPLALERMAALEQARRERFDERLSGWDDADVARFADQLADYNRLLSDDDC